MPSVAVIDIGSNSIKLLVATSDAGGGLTTLASRALDVRISAGLGQTNPRLNEDSMLRALAAIQTLLADAAPFKPARTVLVATSAVRDAQNGPDFRERVRAATGQSIRILSGDEEAASIGRGLTCDPALSQLRDFYGTIAEGLKNKLGPVLFQLPRQLVYSRELLDRIIQSLDQQFINAIEFRDPGWWIPEVEKELTKNKVIFCGISHPTLPDTFMHNRKEVYYRFHGVPKLYYSEYDPEVMPAFAKKLQSPDVQHAYIYFNNTANGSAIHNAEQLKSLTDDG